MCSKVLHNNRRNWQFILKLTIDRYVPSLLVCLGGVFTSIIFLSV